MHIIFWNDSCELNNNQPGGAFVAIYYKCMLWNFQAKLFVGIGKTTKMQILQNEKTAPWSEKMHLKTRTLFISNITPESLDNIILGHSSMPFIFQQSLCFIIYTTINHKRGNHLVVGQNKTMQSWVAFFSSSLFIEATQQEQQTYHSRNYLTIQYWITSWMQYIFQKSLCLLLHNNQPQMWQSLNGLHDVKE